MRAARRTASLPASVHMTEDAVGDAIPLELADRPDIEVDGALVARELGLEVEEFRGLMARGKVSVLCERGTGEDAGLYRASFYHQGRRLRLVVDAEGRLVGHPTADLAPSHA
jgi:hypothetical protein